MAPPIKKLKQSQPNNNFICFITKMGENQIIKIADVKMLGIQASQNRLK